MTQFEDKRVEDANDVEMAKATADLETRIRRAITPRPGNLTFQPLKVCDGKPSRSFEAV